MRPATLVLRLLPLLLLLSILTARAQPPTYQLTWAATPTEIRRPDQIVPNAALASINSLAFTADNQAIATVVGSTPRTPVTATGEKYAAVALPEGRVKLQSLAAAEPPREWAAHRQSVRALALSPDEVQLATAGDDKLIKIWDTKTGALLSTFVGHTGEILALAYSPNGRTLGSGGTDRTICYWTIPLPPIPADDLARIQAAIPAAARVKPKKPRRVLVFWRADAIQHKAGVPAANKMMELLAKKTRAFEVDFSRDYDVLDPKILSRYDAIILNSTAHLAIPDEGKKQAFLDYARGGGAVVGIHAAIDTFKDWPAGAEVIGATFGGHPFVPTGRWAVKLEDPQHPLTRAFAGKGFTVQDEFYIMDPPYTRADREVLLSLDLSDPATGAILRNEPPKEVVRRADHDFAVSWIKHYGAGRVFYADFGHVAGPFGDPAIVQFYLDGIQYALGDLDAGPKSK